MLGSRLCPRLPNERINNVKIFRGCISAKFGGNPGRATHVNLALVDCCMLGQNTSGDKWKRGKKNSCCASTLGDTPSTPHQIMPLHTNLIQSRHYELTIPDNDL
jgi:hypothetical protein